MNDQALVKIIDALFPDVTGYHKNLLLNAMKKGNFVYVANFLETCK